MIGQIGCLGKASPRTGVIAALMYTAGATLGAAVIGLVLGSIGWAARWVIGASGGPASSGILAPVALLALAGGLRDLGFLPLPQPQPRRQVPKGWWEVFGARKTSFLWGLAIGLAYSTRIEYSLYYVMALWVLLAGNPLLGASVLAVYGLAQGALLILEVLAIARNPGLNNGLLGVGRSEVFSRLGGAALLACSLAMAGAFLPRIVPPASQRARRIGVPGTAPVESGRAQGANASSIFARERQSPPEGRTGSSG